MQHKELPEHVQRMVDELSELSVKLEALRSFIACEKNKIFEYLSDIDKDLLKQQYSHMSSYRDVLSQRIEIQIGFKHEA